MKKYDYIIAIDPDVDRSGVAFLEVKSRKLETECLTFPQLMDYLQAVIQQREKKKLLDGFAYKPTDIVVIVEAGWLNSSHWHTRKRDNSCLSAAKGNAVGRNHEVGRKIVEMCKHYGFEVIEQPPLRKCWKGKDGKITHEELFSFTGLIGKTNQDTRDAALIAWNFAGLRMKI